MIHPLQSRGRVRRAACIGALLALAAQANVARAEPGAATAGEYRLDRDHASLLFRINHLGVSNYVAQFMKFDATVRWTPEEPAKASVTFSVEPGSVRTGYTGDFVAGHKDSPWKSFEEEISRDPKFLNADKFGSASFRSTRVEPTTPGHFRVTGDLTLLGQTHPVTLDASIVGETAKHLGTGQPAMGLSASGTIRRSDFGMTYLVDPPLLGNEVTVQFEGEFHRTP